MGAYLSHPVTETENEEGQGNRLQFGASSMQGWRVSQEDAHNCVVDFDKDTSFFGVYDGHGGSEVAVYISQHLPDILKAAESYKKGNWEDALSEAYLHIDESIKQPEVLKEIVRLSKFGKKGGEGEEREQEDVNELREEATMPIQLLMAKYRAKIMDLRAATAEEDQSDEKPGSSKSSQKGSSSSSDESAGPSSSTSTPVKEVIPTNADTKENSVLISEITESEKGEAMDMSTGSSIPANNVTINGEGDKVEDESNEIKPKVNGEAKVNGGEEVSNGTEENGTKTNDSSLISLEVESDSVIIREESIIVTPQKKKGGKVRPPLITHIPKPEPSPEKRTSPRKTSEKVYNDFLKGESNSEESDDDDDDDPTNFGDLDPASDSDDESDEGEEDVNSSSTDDDDEEEGEEEEEEECDEEVEDEEESGDEELLKDYQEPGYDSGATAVTAFTKWEGEKLHLWVANAGDSRCVFSRDGVAVEMSEDHKPEDEKEARRIVTAGGKVTSEGRVNGGLNLSRAIGDHSYKTNPKLPLQEQMITSLPDVKYAELDPKTDKFIVLACDGIWNSLSSQQVIDFVSERIHDPKKKLAEICDELFNVCLASDTTGDGTGCDNMTAIIVRILEEDNSLVNANSTDENTVVESDAINCSTTTENSESEQLKAGIKRPLNRSPNPMSTADDSNSKRVKIDSEEEPSTTV